MVHRTHIARTFAALALAAFATSCASRTGPRRTYEVERPPTSLEVVAPEDGTLLSVLDVAVRRPWAAASEEARARFDEERWSEARLALEGRADQITYVSDGLRVGGFIVRPESVAGRRLPVVVIARDGVGDAGLDVDALLVEMEGWAREGYVAVASAYRGSRLSQGAGTDRADEPADVVALLPLVRELGYVDPSRVYLLGRGLGAQRTLRALEDGAPFRAVALVEPAELRAASDRPTEGDPTWAPVLVASTTEPTSRLQEALAASEEIALVEVDAEGTASGAVREQRAQDAAANWFARHGGRTLLN